MAAAEPVFVGVDVSAPDGDPVVVSLGMKLVDGVPVRVDETVFVWVPETLLVTEALGVLVTAALGVSLALEVPVEEGVNVPLLVDVGEGEVVDSEDPVIVPDCEGLWLVVSAEEEVIVGDIVLDVVVVVSGVGVPEDVDVGSEDTLMDDENEPVRLAVLVCVCVCDDVGVGVELEELELVGESEGENDGEPVAFGEEKDDEVAETVLSAVALKVPDSELVNDEV